LTFFGIILSAGSQFASGLGWDPRGLAFGLLAGVANAVYTLASKRAQSAYTPMTSLFYSFLFGSLTLLTFRFAVVGLTFHLDLTVLVLIVAIAVVPTLIGYGAYTYSLSYIEAGKASITSSADPVFAILLALLFLGEIPSSLQLFGSALIITGVLALQVRTTTLVNGGKSRV
jgi:drug/metabolite transporter (DMT)-like permease